MRVFAVSGYSGTGKTSLIETLIEGLVARGASVTTVKSSMEDVMPPENSDTWKHLRAGAETTILQGPGSTTIRFKERADLERILKHLDSDFLLIEGMKGITIPRFWCMGENHAVDDVPEGTVAIIIWNASRKIPTKVGVPVIPSDDIENLIEIVEREALDVSDLSL